MARAAQLYDHASSKKRRGDTGDKQTDKDRMDEGEGMAAEEAVARKDSADESAGEKKAEGKGDKMSAGLKEIHKRHESERRDFHGNHREALRQMATRHEKDLREFMDGFDAGEAEGDDMEAEAEMADAAVDDATAMEA